MPSSWEIQQPVYVTFSLIAFILAYIPLYWHLEAWNIGTVLWILWAGTGCLIQCINGIIWRDNTVNWAPVWCDIVTRFIHVQPLGIVVASALINHRLYKIVSLCKVSTSQADRRRAAIVDLSIGLGVPAIFMGLYWFVQGHRFDILEGVGCLPTTPNTTVLLLTFSIWPTIILLFSASYGIITIKSFLEHRKDLDLLASGTKSLTSYRYLRLMLFASLDVFFLLPLNIFLLYATQEQPFYPWNGLADLHFGFSQILYVPAEEWRASSSSASQVMLTPCISIAACFVFFAFFGLAKESRVHYSEAFHALTKLLPHSTIHNSQGSYEEAGRPSKFAGALSHMTIPSFVQRSLGKQKKHESILSTLSVSIDIEGHIFYDDPDHEGTEPQDWKEKALPALPGNNVVELRSFPSTTPSHPPGLVPYPPVHIREPRRHTPVTPPPNHTFDAPSSVFTETMGSIV